MGEVKHAEMRNADTGMVRFADEKSAELAISKEMRLLFKRIVLIVLILSLQKSWTALDLTIRRCTCPSSRQHHIQRATISDDYVYLDREIVLFTTQHSFGPLDPSSGNNLKRNGLVGVRIFPF